MPEAASASRVLVIDDEDAVRAALRRVDDPEAGMNIVDLGLVYLIEVASFLVRVDLTMTSAACPMSESVVADAYAAIVAVAPEGTAIDVRLVWDPPWTPDRMTSDARDHFGW